MLERLRNQIGTAGLIVAIVALVAALGGGAYAATSNSGKATASAKGKQGPRGKTGKTGPQGPGGPAGATGQAGAQGPAGPKGDAGTPGATGAPGAPGADGKEGEPWTAGGTLPPEATETGIWGTGESASEGSKRFALSFSIPLEDELPAGNAVVVKSEEQSKPGCPGRGVNGVPMADPGFLCIYVEAEVNVSEIFPTQTIYNEVFEAWEEIPGFVGVDPTGSILKATCAANCFVGGTWAVTAN